MIRASRLRLSSPYNQASMTVSSGIGLTHYGPGLHSGPYSSDAYEGSGMLKSTPRGVKFSNCLDEKDTAIYDSVYPFTYFQPRKVFIEKLGLPHKKYYQRLTRKPWDISWTEWMELTWRKRYVGLWWSSFLICIQLFANKEMQYTGERGYDGFWVMLPKGEYDRF